MLLEENLAHLFLFKNIKTNIDHCLDSTLYRAIYRCIMIHQRQYIDTSTHCIVASLLARLYPELLWLKSTHSNEQMICWVLGTGLLF